MKDIQLHSARLRYEARRKRRSAIINTLSAFCAISFIISVIIVGQIANDTSAFLTICIVIVFCPIITLVLALLLDKNESYTEYTEHNNKKWLM